MADEEAGPAAPLLPPPPQQQQQQHPPGAPPVMSSGGVHLRTALQLEGLAYLLLVSLLWGSYTPALRRVKQAVAALLHSHAHMLQPVPVCHALSSAGADAARHRHWPCRLAYNLPDPPSPVVVAAARGLLQLLLLLLLTAALGIRGGGVPGQAQEAARAGSGMPWLQEEGEEGGGEAGEAAAPAPAGLTAEASQPLLTKQGRGWRGGGSVTDASRSSSSDLQQQEQEQPSPPAAAVAAAVVVEEAPCQAALPLGLPAAVLAGLEIGLYNTTGTLLQTTGMSVSRGSPCLPAASTAPAACSRAGPVLPQCPTGGAGSACLPARDSPTQDIPTRPPRTLPACLPACLPPPLQMTTATRGAFLIQASILFTPLLASLAGMAPSR